MQTDLLLFQTLMKDSENMTLKSIRVRQKGQIIFIFFVACLILLLSWFQSKHTHKYSTSNNDTKLELQQDFQTSNNLIVTSTYGFGHRNNEQLRAIINSSRNNPKHMIYNRIPSLLWKFGIAMLCDKHDSLYYLVHNCGVNEPFVFENVTYMKSNLFNGMLIYIKTRQLNAFVNEILPYYILNHIYFSLIISTNIDYILPLNYIEQVNYNQSFAILIDCPYLLYLFVENYDAISWTKDSFSNKIDDFNIYLTQNIIHPIPIGIDFHTPMRNALSQNFEHIWQNFDLPLILEQNIAHLINKMIEQNNDVNNFNSLKNANSNIDSYYDKKILKVYIDEQLSFFEFFDVEQFDEMYEIRPSFDSINFTISKSKISASNVIDLYRFHKYQNKRNYYRGMVLKLIRNLNDSNVFYFDYWHYPQKQGWIERSQFAFSLTLLGNGFDCHRTYEALLFDNIVITISSPLDILYQLHKLPVVTVNDVKEINSTMLKYWYQKYKDRTFLNCLRTRQVLTSKYWIQYIKLLTNKKLKNVMKNNQVR